MKESPVKRWSLTCCCCTGIVDDAIAIPQLGLFPLLLPQLGLPLVQSEEALYKLITPINLCSATQRSIGASLSVSLCAQISQLMKSGVLPFLGTIPKIPFPFGVMKFTNCTTSFFNFRPIDLSLDLRLQGHFSIFV